MDRLLGRTLGAHVSLDTDPAPEPCLVEADPAQLEQVVLNLVVNARDALPRGGGIRVETRRAGPEVVLSVSDGGEGMEPEVVARAFEPFFTTKPKGAGTGLGLATVYGTVTQAGGHAEIESEPGRGTSVRIHLPSAAERAEPAEPLPDEARDGDGGTVLVVEDEDAVRTLTSRILAASGFECLEASGGEEALRLYDMNRERVDLLLTDVVMPGMQGKELAERIAVEGSGPPVLFMSGYTDDEVLRHSGPTAAGPLVQQAVHRRRAAAQRARRTRGRARLTASAAQPPAGHRDGGGSRRARSPWRRAAWRASGALGSGDAARTGRSGARTRASARRDP